MPKAHRADNGASAEAGAYGTLNEMAFQNNMVMATEDIKPRLGDIGGPSLITVGWAEVWEG